MKSFEYAAPKTLKEATALLSDTWGKTEILAGGTDLVTSLKQHITTPARVVSLKNISGLKGIKSERGGVRIGAMAVSTVMMAVLLAAPFINVLIWRGGARWIAAYGVVAAVGLVVVTLGI